MILKSFCRPLTRRPQNAAGSYRKSCLYILAIDILFNLIPRSVIMDVKYLKEVCDLIEPFMTENGYSSKDLDTGSFKGETKTFKVSYSEEEKSFAISVADIGAVGETGDFKTLSTWYFNEEDHGAKDTHLIAEDFTEAAAKSLGIKIVRAEESGEIKSVALPERAEAGTDPGINAFAQKFLALFPQYKDTYREMVAKYGEFLYVEFFKNCGIEKMRELIADESKNKKQLGKYFNMLGEMHYSGEQVVGDVICSVILAGTFGNDPAGFNALAEKYLEDYPFLKTAGAAAVSNYKSNKKLRKLLEQ